jgi:hypothetical protein
MVDRSGDESWDAALRAPDGLLRGPSGASLSARLERWVAEARVDDAAAQRSRERWLREVAEQEATLAGVLADLAERRTAVAVRTTAGRQHHGTIQVIGADFVALRLATGAEVLLAGRGLGAVRTAPDVEVALGDRPITTELRFADVLTELAAERERVLVVTTSGDDAIAGELRSVGLDVVVLRAEAARPSTAYVPLAAIGEVALG